MSQINTKLVKCGEHIEIFDYECPVKNKNFKYERKGEVRIPRHIRMNFNTKGQLSYAQLIIDSTDCRTIRDELEKWFKHFTAPILAAIEPLPTKIMVYILHSHLDDLLQQNPFKNLVSCKVYTAKAKKVMQVFINAFERAVGDELRKAKAFLIEHNLKKPEVLWNRRAEAFIKKHNLINRIPYKKLDLWDRGWYSYSCYHI